MMIGREEGKLRPWSLSLMSFMAIENSSLSILPSLSVSARCLQEEEEEEGREKTIVTQAKIRTHCNEPRRKLNRKPKAGRTI